MTEKLIEKLNAEAKYLQISLPYDKDDHLITFDDGMMTELECDDDFVLPMLNPETLLLEYVIDVNFEAKFALTTMASLSRLRSPVLLATTGDLVGYDSPSAWHA